MSFWKRIFKKSASYPSLAKGAFKLSDYTEMLNSNKILILNKSYDSSFGYASIQDIMDIMTAEKRVYAIDTFVAPEIAPVFISSLSITNSDVTFWVSASPTPWSGEYDLDDFGKVIFFTREEAERALVKQSEDNCHES